ncbi:hypothetical protein LTS10_002463 [Elasticomyces elasticus]|nr:hypothetical protein LTS10_002463 [Elasticomyces elasticus]
MAPKKGSVEMSQTALPAFRLLDLPPELFVHICRYAIPADKKFVISRSNYNDGSMIMQPAITRVCKLLREELLPIFYTSNTFIYHEKRKEPIGWANRLTGFLRRVPLACKPEAMRILVTSKNQDTQAFLDAPLQFIGYGLERCTGQAALGREGGKLTRKEAARTRFRVVRRS